MIESLIQNESGGNWQAQNSEVGAGGQAGHYGRLQFGHARLQDAMNAGVLPQGTSPQQFMADPAMQQRVEAWHFDDIDRQAQRMGLNQYVGQQVGGVLITQDAIRSMAHLGGIGGAARFLESGGQYNPSDSFGTSLRDYAQAHGTSAGGQSRQPQPQGNALMGPPGQQQQPMQNIMVTQEAAPPELQFQTNALNAADFAQPTQQNSLAQFGFAPGQSPFL